MWSSQLGIKDPKSMTQICISVKGLELGSVVLCMGGTGSVLCVLALEIIT